MKRRNRIISLVDFSEYSDRVIRFTSEFSNLIEAKVVFIHHVAGLVPALADSESRRKIIDFEKKEAIRKLKENTKLQFYLTPHYIVSDKKITTILAELKTDDFFDWVFVGLKGTGLLKKVFLGSTAVKIIDETDFLSIAFPLTKSVSLPKELVVAVSPKYPVNVFQLKNVFSNLSATVEKITFISILPSKSNEIETRNYMQQLKDDCSEYHTTDIIFIADDPFAEIHNYLKNRDHVFLVVQQGSRTMKDTFFRKYLINELVYHGSIPLIVISL